MGRVVDADVLADELAVLIERNTKLIDEWLANLIEDAVDDAPTVDAVEVVRCKDCKHLSVCSGALGVYKCDIHDDFPSGEYFCADGERKEDEIN